MKTDYFDILFISKISDVLVQSRRQVKGARLSYLMPILLVGKSGRLRLKDAVSITGLKKSNVSKRLQRVSKAGFINKNGFDYYLTEHGRIVYNNVNQRLQPVLKTIAESMELSIRLELAREAKPAYPNRAHV